MRRLIGVVPQENNLDRYLTARENLALHARMHGMHRRDFNPRIDELLELTGLSGRQHDFPDTFSGGMQRRWWWPEHWSTTRRSCSWTSRPQVSIPSRAGPCGITSCHYGQR